MADDEDEFKDVGRYFPEDGYVQLPLRDQGPRCTAMGWFIWLEGDGPLFVTEDEGWSFLYDRDGHCAYRLGGVERVTSLPTASARDRWIFVVVAKDEADVTLWINDGAVDHWEDAPVDVPLSETYVMRHAVGFAADIAIFDRRLPDDRLRVLWNAGKGRV
jgi:hypothetical protein